MRKKIFTLAIASVATIASQAQNTFPSTGNVGIGTVTPTVRLDVFNATGGVAVQVKSNTASAFIFMDKKNPGNSNTVSYRTNGVAIWQTGGLGNDDYTIRNLNIGTSPITCLVANNFVGINNPAPTSQLHVIGTGRIDGNLQVSNNSTFGASMNVSGNITASGTLTAGGNVFFGDTINFGSAENFIDAGGNSIATNDKLTVGSFTEGTNTFNVVGTAGISSNATIGGTLAVTGATTCGNKLTITSGGVNVIAGDIFSGADLYTSSGNGVINCGGDSMSSFINVMSDVFTPGTSNLNANGDEDLFIGGDLEVVGKGFQTGGGAWGVRSDRRLKKDITPFKDGLEQLLKINPVTFKYNDKFPHADGREFVGIIAQDMQEIAPYMVEEKPMGQIVEEDANGNEVIVKQGTNYLTFDPNALWYITINAIKEQQKIINEQQQKIEALEAMINNSAGNAKSANESAAIRADYSLEQNTPNPFNQTTIIRFNCGDAAQASIIIRDLNGNLVKSLNAAGKTQVIVNANELAQGTYTYTLEIGSRSADTKLMVVTK
ncbi:MAG: tail fiber domain-containing protein [Bacteroidetes bacterium]|nr:tail fiber domain-containing protein [Bacteroidota bacterium]